MATVFQVRTEECIGKHKNEWHTTLRFPAHKQRMPEEEIQRLPQKHIRYVAPLFKLSCTCGIIWNLSCTCGICPALMESILHFCHLAILHLACFIDFLFPSEVVYYYFCNFTKKISKIILLMVKQPVQSDVLVWYRSLSLSYKMLHDIWWSAKEQRNSLV